MSRVRVKLAVKLLVTVLLLWLAFRNVEFSAMARLLSSLSPMWLGGALLLTLLMIVADGLLLAAVLRTFDHRVPFMTAMLYSFVSWFFSNVGPSTVGGDLYRGVQLTRVGVPVGTAVRAVLAIRLVSLTALVFVMLVGFPIALRQVVNPQGIVMLAGTLAAAIAALLAINFYSVLDERLAILDRWAMLGKLKTVSTDFQKFLFPGRHILAVWLTATVQHLLRVGVLAAIAASLNLGIPLATLFALTPAALLVAMVPISLGGWGVREVTFVYFLATAGVEPAAALSLSIAFGLLRMMVGAIGGLMWVVMNESHFRLSSPPT